MSVGEGKSSPRINSYDTSLRGTRSSWHWVVKLIIQKLIAYLANLKDLVKKIDEEKKSSHFL